MDKRIVGITTSYSGQFENLEESSFLWSSGAGTLPATRSSFSEGDSFCDDDLFEEMFSHAPPAVPVPFYETLDRSKLNVVVDVPEDDKYFDNTIFVEDCPAMLYSGPLEPSYSRHIDYALPPISKDVRYSVTSVAHARQKCSLTCTTVGIRIDWVWRLQRLLRAANMISINFTNASPPPNGFAFGGVGFSVEESFWINYFVRLGLASNAVQRGLVRPSRVYFLRYSKKNGWYHNSIDCSYTSNGLGVLVKYHAVQAGVVAFRATQNHYTTYAPVGQTMFLEGRSLVPLADAIPVCSHFGKRDALRCLYCSKVLK